MNKKSFNYDILLKITKAMSMSKDPEKVVVQTVKSIKEAMDIKGCALFLIDPKNRKLEVAASLGLSEEYLNKGPLSPFGTIEDGPVAIYDVTDDPRIQYPKEAKKEGIASILSVPIVFKGDVIGSIRVYTSEPWDFTLEDVNFVQALAQIAGIMIEMCRLYKGQNEYIDVLTTMRETLPL